MKKLAVVATAFVALGALSSARAADLPPPVIAKAPVVVPWSWTGPYIGATAVTLGKLGQHQRRRYAYFSGNYDSIGHHSQP